MVRPSATAGCHPTPNTSEECDHECMLREHADEVSHRCPKTWYIERDFSTLCMSSSMRICSAQTRKHPRALSRPTRKVPSRYLVSVRRNVKVEGILGQLTTTTTSLSPPDAQLAVQEHFADYSSRASTSARVTSILSRLAKPLSLLSVSLATETRAAAEPCMASVTDALISRQPTLKRR